MYRNRSEARPRDNFIDDTNQSLNTSTFMWHGVLDSTA